MSDGISALEGFAYQAMVALELMLDHFHDQGPGARARPEGIEDLDLVHTAGGVVHRTYIQVKKPRQDKAGERTPTPWSLSDAVEQLLSPRWEEVGDPNVVLRWALGDVLGPDTVALFGERDSPPTWAARRAAAELIVRTRGLASRPVGARDVRWASPFGGESQPRDLLQLASDEWSASFERRASRAGFGPDATDTWKQRIAQTHTTLDDAMARVSALAPYAEVDALRDRLTDRLATDYGLDPVVVRDVVLRNLRGWVDDVARARGVWVDAAALERELLTVWPQRVPTVHPPPFPRPFLPRPDWTCRLAATCGAVVGPAGSGKTTSATELFLHLQYTEPDTVVVYAEVRSGLRLRNILEGVAYSVSRQGNVSSLALLPDLRSGDVDALLRMADALEANHRPVALLIDLVDGTADPSIVRDLEQFVLRLPPSPRTRLWVFGQVDALGEVSGTELRIRGLASLSATGLDFEAFLELAALHGKKGRRPLHAVFEALTSGRSTGIGPRVATSVLGLDSIDDALRAARSDDVLLEADRRRYHRLPDGPRTALGALSCIAHPFRRHDVESMLPSHPVRAGIREGVRSGLLTDLGDERFEFHETVRRNILGEQPRAVRRLVHARLADVHLSRGDRVLEAHHADAAGDHVRAREAGRAAFFDVDQAGRISARAIADGWVTAREAYELLRARPNGPWAWWDVLEAGLDDDTAADVLAWWREVMDDEGNDQVLWSAPKALCAARPDMLASLLQAVLSARPDGKRKYGSSALGVALREIDHQQALVLEHFDRASEDGKFALAPALRSSHLPLLLARWLAWRSQQGPSERDIGDVALEAAHIDAMLDALPDVKPADMWVRWDWLFGDATPFLWRHRDALAAGVARALSDDTLPPKQARIALRLLGLSGSPELADLAHSRAVRRDDAAPTALVVPLVAETLTWRPRLAAMSLDEGLLRDTRIAAFSFYLQSGTGGEELFNRLVAVSPELEALARFMAAMSLAMRPSLFGLGCLVEELEAGVEEAPWGMLLYKAANLADGEDAPAAAVALLRSLARSGQDAWNSATLALRALRDEQVLHPAVQLALDRAGTQEGDEATFTACASRPQRLDDVEGAIRANSGVSWLLPVMVARLGDGAARDELVSLAADRQTPWEVRRAALRALERLPNGPGLSTLLRGILAEHSLLGSNDSVSAQVTAATAGGFQHETEAFVFLWRQGESAFVTELSEMIGKQEVESATPMEVQNCLSTVWRALRGHVDRGARGSDAIRALLNDLQLLQVQAAGLEVARKFEMPEVLEEAIARNQSRWLVARALMARALIEPRNFADAKRWEAQLSASPCRPTAHLQRILHSLMDDARQREAGPFPRRLVASSAVSVLSGAEVLRRVQAEQAPTSNMRIDEIDEPLLSEIVTALDPSEDLAIESIGAGDDAERVSLTAASVRVRPPATRHHGRKGNRPAWRARLYARHAERLPVTWIPRLRLDPAFVSNLVLGLAEEGDPRRAREVLTSLPDGGASTIQARQHFYRLGAIADDDLVRWVARWVGSGGPSEVEALASFARGADTPAVVPLLGALMRRIAGILVDRNIEVPHDPDDPRWRAFSHVRQAKRLVDVPGAGAWLVRHLQRTRDPWLRAAIVQSMRQFPSTWANVEAEALNSFEYGLRWGCNSREADAIAHELFSKRTAADDD